MKVGIIGAGGCFAQDFARHVQALGIECFGLGRSKKYGAFWLMPPGYRFHTMHLLKELHPMMAVIDTERPDVIVNYAAQGEGAASFHEHAPDFFMTNCVGLTRFVLELQKRPYIKRFVHIGSSEVYGSEQNGSKETDPLWPTSPYGASKAAFDHYLQIMWRTHKFPMNIVRPSNCYVEGQQLHRVIPKAIVSAMKGVKLPLQGGGRAMKSYLYARDLSRAVTLVLERGEVGAVYNVGPDEPISIRDLVAEVAAVCLKTFDELVSEAPERLGQDAKYHLNCDAIKALGWKQEVPLNVGLSWMAQWVNGHPELLSMDTTYRHAA